jgi:hypothetical protein
VTERDESKELFLVKWQSWSSSSMRSEREYWSGVEDSGAQVRERERERGGGGA